MLPRFLHIGDVLAVGRGQADTDAQVRQFQMRIVPAMHLGDRLGINIAGLGLDQHAFLKVRFENALQRNEEGRAVVAMPVGVAAGNDLGVVDLYLDLRILWN